mmetsp:Transcript_14533/g.36157  ORF Transcript_14533/g.36157 Transcript_14533/m.36157 type:complete len:120 (-) Transcript_14533:2389-2748(-)
MLATKQTLKLTQRAGVIQPISVLRTVPKRTPLRVMNAVVQGRGPSYDRKDHDLVMKMRAEKVAKYTAQWKSDVDMENKWNVMTVLLMIAFGSPLIGLVFAAATYGTLWGLSAQTMLPPM